MTAARTRRDGGRIGWIPRIQYMPGDSSLHRANPIAKLGLLVGATVAVFLLDRTWELLLALGVLLALFPAARLRWWDLRAASRFFITFSLMLMLLHAFFVHVGAVVWEARAGPLHVLVTWGGLELGLDMVARFLVVVLGSFLFVATTEPNALAHSLMGAGVPYRAGFALVLALRLMPLLRSEAGAVREAQAARGLAVDRPGPAAAMRSVRSMFMPMLVASLSRVDSLVISMEGRAFGRHPTRTFLREVRWRAGDTALLAFAIAMPVIAGLLRWS